MSKLIKQTDEQFNWLLKNAERQRQAEAQRERVKEGIRVDLDEARFRQALRFAGFSDAQINGEIQRQIQKGIAKPEPVLDAGAAGKDEPIESAKSGAVLIKQRGLNVRSDREPRVLWFNDVNDLYERGPKIEDLELGDYARLRANVSTKVLVLEKIEITWSGGKNLNRLLWKELAPGEVPAFIKDAGIPGTPVAGKLKLDKVVDFRNSFDEVAKRAAQAKDEVRLFKERVSFLSDQPTSGQPVKPPSFGAAAEMLTEWLDGKLPQVVTIKSERFVVIEDGAALKSERDGRIVRLAEQPAAAQGEQPLLPERVVTFDESEV